MLDMFLEPGPAVGVDGADGAQVVRQWWNTWRRGAVRDRGMNRDGRRGCI